MLIPHKKLEDLITLDSVIILVVLMLFAILVYAFLRYRLTTDRKLRFRTLFQNLFRYTLSFAVSYAFFEILKHGADSDPLMISGQGFIGLATLILGAVVFVKTCRVLLYEYLFATSLKYGVPVLLVNIFTLILSLTIATWFATYLFNIRIVSVLATSAIASVILGLALQETLGNLFSGIALQFDKPFEIDDWVEIHNNGAKQIGKVTEITWRATSLLGLGDETITVPNQILAKAQVTNYSIHGRAFVRRHTLRVAHSEDVERTRKALLDGLKGVEGVEKFPAPDVYLVDLHENGLEFRVVYYIRNFSQQFTIADHVLKNCVESLRRSGLKLVKPQLQVSGSLGEPLA